MTLATWHTKSWPRMLVASKAVFLENYLAVSTWILNGSSIECLEKKYQHFSLAAVQFGSRVNQISGLKSAWRRSGLRLTLLLCNCCYKRRLRNNPRNQTYIQTQCHFNCAKISIMYNKKLFTGLEILNSIDPRSMSAKYQTIMPTYSSTVVFFATKLE